MHLVERDHVERRALEPAQQAGRGIPGVTSSRSFGSNSVRAPRAHVMPAYRMVPTPPTTAHDMMQAGGVKRFQPGPDDGLLHARRGFFRSPAGSIGRRFQPAIENIYGHVTRADRARPDGYLAAIPAARQLPASRRKKPAIHQPLARQPLSTDCQVGGHQHRARRPAARTVRARCRRRSRRRSPRDRSCAPAPRSPSPASARRRARARHGRHRRSRPDARAMLVAGDDVAERAVPRTSSAMPGAFGSFRNDRQVGRAEGQIDQHHVGVLRQRAGERRSLHRWCRHCAWCRPR